ncbi:AAA family ATPase, partial [Klebsiella pneumoniae]
AGEVPETLRDKRLVELNINAMVAGAKYRGEFEERVQKVLKEVTEHQGELILFIDEVHTIVGAGQGGGEGGLTAMHHPFTSPKDMTADEL